MSEVRCRKSEVGVSGSQGANSTAGVREREDANRTREAGDSVLVKTEKSAFHLGSTSQPLNVLSDVSVSAFSFCISAAPAALDRYPRGCTGHVARPTRSIQLSGSTSQHLNAPFDVSFSLGSTSQLNLSTPQRLNLF